MEITVEDRFPAEYAVPCLHTLVPERSGLPSSRFASVRFRQSHSAYRLKRGSAFSSSSDNRHDSFSLQVRFERIQALPIYFRPAPLLRLTGLKASIQDFACDKQAPVQDCSISSCLMLLCRSLPVADDQR